MTQLANATTPLVSICLPAYNHAPYIRMALMSCVRQQYPNLEILVGNNASTDGTGEICDEIAARYGHVHVLHGPHISAAHNHNRLLFSSRGEYVCIMHADDLMYPDKIAKQLEFFRSQPAAGACFTLTDFINGDSNLVKLDSDLFQVPMVTKQIHERLIVGNFLCMPSVMLRRDIIDRVGGMDTQNILCMTDYDYWLRVMKVADLTLLCEPLMAYRLHAKSSSVTQTSIMEKEGHQVLARHARSLLAARPEFGITMHEVWQTLAANALSKGHWEDARQYTSRRVKTGGINAADVLMISYCLLREGRKSDAELLMHEALNGELTLSEKSDVCASQVSKSC